MQTDYNLSLEKGKEVIIQGNANQVEVTGEQIDAPFISAGASGECCFEINITDQEKKNSNDLNDICEILNEDKTYIRLKPDEERKYVFHLPAAWEQNMTVELTNGKISLKGLSGKLHARSSNGSVELRDLTGVIGCLCSNGSVEGSKINGDVDITTSNGKVVLTESSIKSGSIKSGNGKISLQLEGSGAGSLNLFSGNGKVKVALKDDLEAIIKVQTKGKLINHLEGYAVMTENEVTTLKKGAGNYGIGIANFAGGVRLMKFEDFAKDFKDEDFGFDFEAEFDPGEFFDQVFNRGFGQMFPKFLHKMMHMGRRMSRKFGDWGQEGEGGGKEDDIRMVLDMLKEGKISPEEAERLINAIKTK